MQFDLPATSIVSGLGVGGSYEIELLPQDAALQAGLNYLVTTNVGQGAIATFVCSKGDKLFFAKLIIDGTRDDGVAAKTFNIDRPWVENFGNVRRRLPDPPEATPNKKRPHTASQQPRACRRRGKLRSAVAAA